MIISSKVCGKVNLIVDGSVNCALSSDQQNVLLSHGRCDFKGFWERFRLLELVAGRAVQRRLQHVWVLRLAAQLLLLAALARSRPIPVGVDRLVVPDSGGLRVADVARVARVVRGVNQQRFGRKRTQIPPLEVRHVVLTTQTEMKTTWVMLEYDTNNNTKQNTQNNRTTNDNETNMISIYICIKHIQWN